MAVQTEELILVLKMKLLVQHRTGGQLGLLS